jgi:hypothetical protein
MVPLLTLPRVWQRVLEQMIFRHNDLWMNDLPVEIELSRT